MNIVTFFILLNTLISFQGFRSPSFLDNYLLYPYRAHKEERYTPVLTSGFLHRDEVHLIFNMLALAGFGGATLQGKPSVGSFMDVLLSNGRSYLFATLLFLGCYLGSILISNLVLYWRYRDDPYYQFLGSSAGVGAITAATIVFTPFLRVLILPIPIPISGILYEAGVLIYSFFMCNSNDSTAHLAHLVGGVYGVLFGFAVQYFLLL